MKDHNSHDILLLCTSCHAASNVHDGFLKQQLAKEFAAPQGCEEGVRLLEDSDRRRVRSAARALLSAGEGLPESRREELQVLIRNFLNMNEEQELTDEALQQAASLETRSVPPEGFGHLSFMSVNIQRIGVFVFLLETFLLVILLISKKYQQILGL